MQTPTTSDLLDRVIPDGTYSLTAERHRRLLQHTYADEDGFASDVGAPAHPIFNHLVTHIGKGWTFDEFLVQAGATHDAGVVFGGGTWQIAQPLRVGAEYRVRAHVSSVERKTGRRAGTFDVIELTHEVEPADAPGEHLLRTTETFIVPRAAITGEGTGSSTSGSSTQISAPAASGAAPARRADVYTVGPIDPVAIRGIMDLMGDTNPVHVDAALARASGYRGPVNQGPANLAYVFNALRERRGQVDDLVRAEFRFQETVTEGDLLEVLLDPSPKGADVDECDATLVIVGAGTALRCRVGFDPTG